MADYNWNDPTGAGFVANYGNANYTSAYNFTVRKQTSQTAVFKCDSDGFLFYGDLVRSGTHGFRADSASTCIATFTRVYPTGHTPGEGYRLSIGYDSVAQEVAFGTCAISSADGQSQWLGNTVFRSAGHIEVLLDSGGASPKNYVRVADAARSVSLQISDAGEFYLMDGGSPRVKVYAGALDSIIDIGAGLALRGELWMSNDTTGGSEKAGVLKMADKDGNFHWIWVDSTGLLRVWTSDPGTNDTAGGASSIVGLQA